MKPYRISHGRVLETEAGYVRRFIRKGDIGVIEAEEVYFSEIRPGIVRGWYSNKLSVANLCVVQGEVRFLIKQETEGLTHGPISLTPTENARLTIQPRCWYAFKAYGTGNAVICNALENKYEAEHLSRLEFSEDPVIWSRKTIY